MAFRWNIFVGIPMNTRANWFIAVALVFLAIGGCSSDDEIAAAIRGNEKLPDGTPVPFLLYQNEPNPFNPTTTIRFDVATAQHLRLRVYTEDWQETAVLVDEVKLPGIYQIAFNAVNLPSGVYYYTMEGSDITQIRAMRLVK
jgi:hypothetical protein